MPENRYPISHLNIDTFGEMLKFLRKRAQLTQRELAIAVGYSEAHVSRLESNQRLPDLSALAALFVPVLGLDDEPYDAARLLELAATARNESIPSGGKLTITGSIENEVVETIETVEIPGSLPLQLTSFIGREKEIDEIKQFLQGANKVRLLSLVGAGGCGKTRLAVEVAEKLVVDYPDGVWFIDLAPLTDPNLIAPATATTLGLLETPGQEFTSNLIAFLRPKKTLLLFDNCEHILTGVSYLIELLLRACPRLQILATSREVLNIQGERQFHVAPLSYPHEENLAINIIGEFDAVRLFIQRARNVQPSFDLTDENATYVAQVCRRLDGIPLAIELAAARVGLLRVQQIETQLKDRFKLLTTGGRTLPRHQTLRAMLDWSHHLLSEEEGKFFRRLSVFAGGWTLEAAEAVVTETQQTSTLEYLSHLVDKSFIVTERRPGMEARYTMLETIREYARGKLHEAGEISKFQQRHFEYFLDLAGRAMVFGPQKSIWLNRLEAEQDNFRATLAWSLESESTKQVEQATYLLGLLADYSFHRGYVMEALEWFDKLLSFDLPPTPGRALGFQKAGFLTRIRGDFEKAADFLEQALTIADEIGDKERAGWALLDLGTAARDMGKTEEVTPDFSKALSRFQELGDARGMLNAYYQLATTYVQTRELSKARSFWESGLELSRKMNDKSFIAWGLEGLADTAFLENQPQKARMLHRESLKSKLEAMDKAGLAYSFEGLAQVAVLDGEPEHAAVLWGAAEQVRSLLKMPLDPSREDIYTSLIPTTREQIGDELFDEAWKKGETMELEDAIQYALQGYSRSQSDIETK